jgi:hypothetical protein
VSVEVLYVKHEKCIANIDASIHCRCIDRGIFSAIIVHMHEYALYFVFLISIFKGKTQRHNRIYCTVYVLISSL